MTTHITPGYAWLAKDRHGAMLIWSTLYDTAEEAIADRGHMLPDLGWTLHRVGPAEVLV
jgi:hypothetical protein